MNKILLSVSEYFVTNLLFYISNVANGFIKISVFSAYTFTVIKNAIKSNVHVVQRGEIFTLWYFTRKKFLEFF